MSNIDWSKAPEGATHFCTGSIDGTPWRNYGGEYGLYWHNGQWKHHHDRSSSIVARMNDLVARPVVWTGEGKPPVGVPIEMKHKAATSEWARPDFHVETLVWVGGKRFVTSEEKVGDLSDYLFRPIRTPEQIAAEKREADIEELRVLLSNVACDDYQAAVAMIDAGYHK